MQKQSKKTKKKRSKKIGKTSSKVSFDAFFRKCVREGKLRVEQKAEIQAFFKDMKLKNDEDSDTYEKVLKNY